MIEGLEFATVVLYFDKANLKYNSTKIFLEGFSQMIYTNCLLANNSLVQAYI